MEEQKLTKQECFNILDRYATWNKAQKSISLAFNYTKTEEATIHDARRALLKKVTKRLAQLI